MAKVIVVFGGGVTGLTVAAELAADRRNRVVLLEKAPHLGGLASTLQSDGLVFDNGSHRLHEEYVPIVAQLLQELCGDDLVRRERNGLIFIRGKPLRYPPTVFDIVSSLTPREAVAAVRDLVRARMRARRADSGSDFEQNTISRVGRLLYERFYQPYAEKLYGLPLTELGIEPALTRVHRFQTRAIARDLLWHVTRRHAYYRYPRHRIGQIASELNKRFLGRGGEVVHIRAVKLCVSDGMRRIRTVVFQDHDGEEQTIPVDILISTIPIRALFELLYPGIPPPDIRWRDLRIVYLVCSGQLNAPHETYYCPDSDIIFGRVSDLNKYSPELNASDDSFVLAAEIPYSPGDAIYSADESEISARCLADLKRLKAVPCTTQILKSVSRTLRYVYPVYDLHWKEGFDSAYSLLDRTENLYMVGRTALFMHCNIDHCMLMALELAKDLEQRLDDKAAWTAELARFTAYRIRE